MLMTLSKNPALLQKVFEDWLRLPERQDLFAGLLDGGLKVSRSCLLKLPIFVVQKGRPANNSCLSGSLSQSYKTFCESAGFSTLSSAKKHAHFKFYTSTLYFNELTENFSLWSKVLCVGKLTFIAEIIFHRVLHVCGSRASIQII